MEDESPLRVNVRYVDEPALWSWEITDATSKQQVKSGWVDEWIAYRTRDEACAAGLETLDGMLGRADEASLLERFEACQLEHTDRAVLGSAG
jgi:hypothetical protein